MTAEQLKNSILQMAVQGKLVPQDPNDEPASELIKRIREEKERLIKEGKIKKEKNPSYIFRGEDNIPYEKVGKNEPVSIADEVPFEIPESWEWVRLGNIGDWGSGATPSRTKPEYYGGKIPWLKTGDLNDGYVDEVPEYISELALEQTSVRLNPAGSVLMAMYGATIGKLGINTFPLTTNQACCACFPLGGFSNEYLFYFLMSQKVNFIKQGEGGAQPNISKEKIVKTLMPVPPIEEQVRIIGKIKELLPYVSKYDSAKSTVDNINKNFPDQLKKSILQEAVMGKLVPQDENDEPASVLLERIREEKQRLIAEGKLKKDKHESIIYCRDNSHYEKLDGVERYIDDEIPFEIPETWAWCRLNNLATIQSSKRVFEKDYVSEGVPFYRSKEIGNLYRGEAVRTELFITNEHYKELSEKYGVPTSGDILITSVGTIGNTWICDDRKFYYKDGNITQICSNTYFDSEYVEAYLHCPFFESNTKSTVAGTAYSALTIIKLKNMLIPLPPLNEQKRIIKELKRLIPCINKL